ncbi:MAG: sugar phosphate isomerase/epimerase [Chloroflexi bacterium]|nr:sugar phosphate isomerase/epimerase [Chloroflexota bacterium]
MSGIPIALQLYTVRDQTAIDFAGTVRKVAAMGYSGAELAGFGGLSAQALAELLAETKLKPAGMHIGMELFQTDIVRVIDDCKTIGSKFAGVPALPGALRNLQGFRQAAASLNQFGAALKAEGISLYYHNHAFEFEVMDGLRGIDILLAETDPALVGFEADVYWIKYGGDDPAAFLKAHSGRFPLVHLKDMTGEGDKRTFTEIGNGTVDMKAIFKVAEAQPVEWYIVEQDTCARPSLESAKISVENLHKWGKG